MWLKKVPPMSLWHMDDRREAKLMYSSAESYFWKTGVQLKSYPWQRDYWEACAMKSAEKLQLASVGSEGALWPVIWKEKDKGKNPGTDLLGVKKSLLPVENYNCQITGYILKAAFMYIISIAFWVDRAVKYIPNCCSFSWKCCFLSEMTLSKI